MSAFKRAGAPRAALLAIGTLAALWITMGVTLTLTLGNVRPDIALAVWPWGAASRAREASAVTQETSSSAAQRTAAGINAGRALRREPGNVIALRSLGVIAALRGYDTTARYFRLAERFSRRDLVVQMALIEAEVVRNDVDGALAHYDRALRTGYRAYDLLFPVLVAASHDQAVARPLGNRLAARPAWWNAFVERSIQDAAPNPSLAWLVRQVRLRTDRPDERAFLIAAMQRLIKQGDIAGALNLYRDARGPAMARQLVRDGGFERDDQLPPFEWQLTDTTDLAAVRQPIDGSMRLELVANGDAVGTLAQQLLTLTPGLYRTRLSLGDVQPGNFSLQISCVGKAGSRLLDQTIDGPANRGGLLTAQVTVPAAACPAQWLAIVANGQSDRGTDDSAAPWLDNVRIDRVAR